jgi:hypothetical protein
MGLAVTGSARQAMYQRESGSSRCGAVDHRTPPTCTEYRTCGAVAVALVMLGSRLLTVGAYLAADAAGGRHVFAAWDARHYLRIAALGYPPNLQGRLTHGSDWAFFPLFPMGVDVVHWLTPLSLAGSGLVLNAAADVLLAAALWRLSTAVLDRRSAMWANILFWLFPGSAVLSMNYSEPLFLAFAALSLCLLIERRWLLAGVTAALSLTARPAGLAVAAACLVAAIGAIRSDRDWRALVAPALAPVGLIAFLLYSSARTGHWNEWLRGQAEWHQSFDFSKDLPAMLARGLSRSALLRPELIALSIGLVFFVVAVGLCWRQLVRLPAPLLAYFAVVFVLTFGSSHVSAKPRFLLVMLPLFFALGSRLRGRSAPMVSAVFAVGLPVLLFLYLTPRHFVP